MIRQQQFRVSLRLGGGDDRNVSASARRNARTLSATRPSSRAKWSRRSPQRRTAPVRHGRTLSDRAQPLERRLRRCERSAERVARRLAAIPQIEHRRSGGQPLLGPLARCPFCAIRCRSRPRRTSTRGRSKQSPRVAAAERMRTRCRHGGARKHRRVILAAAVLPTPASLVSALNARPFSTQPRYPASSTIERTSACHSGRSRSRPAHDSAMAIPTISAASELLMPARLGADPLAKATKYPVPELAAWKIAREPCGGHLDVVPPAAEARRGDCSCEMATDSWWVAFYSLVPGIPDVFASMARITAIETTRRQEHEPARDRCATSDRPAGVVRGRVPKTSSRPGTHHAAAGAVPISAAASDRACAGTRPGPSPRVPLSSRPADTDARRAWRRPSWREDVLPRRRRATSAVSARSRRSRAPARAREQHGIWTPRRRAKSDCKWVELPARRRPDVAARGEDAAVESPAVHAHEHNGSPAPGMSGIRGLLGRSRVSTPSSTSEQRERLDAAPGDVARRDEILPVEKRAGRVLEGDEIPRSTRTGQRLSAFKAPGMAHLGQPSPPPALLASAVPRASG